MRLLFQMCRPIIIDIDEEEIIVIYGSRRVLFVRGQPGACGIARGLWHGCGMWRKAGKSGT